MFLLKSVNIFKRTILINLYCEIALRTREICIRAEPMFSLIVVLVLRLHIFSHIALWKVIAMRIRLDDLCVTLGRKKLLMVPRSSFLMIQIYILI